MPLSSGLCDGNETGGQGGRCLWREGECIRPFMPQLPVCSAINTSGRQSRRAPASSPRASPGIGMKRSSQIPTHSTSTASSTPSILWDLAMADIVALRNILQRLNWRSPSVRCTHARLWIEKLIHFFASHSVPEVAELEGGHSVRRAPVFGSEGRYWNRRIAGHLLRYVD